jgi:hypothetical protein
LVRLGHGHARSCLTNADGICSNSNINSKRNAEQQKAQGLLAEQMPRLLLPLKAAGKNGSKQAAVQIDGWISTVLK